MIEESRDQHFERILPHSRLVIAASVGAYLLYFLWVYFSVDNGKIVMLQAIAALIIGLSAFVAGNTYRLRDVRRRQAYRLGRLPREDVSARTAAWNNLVPPETIHFRFRLASSGIAFGVFAQIAIGLVFIQISQESLGVTATFLVVVLAGLLFLAGTYTRPVD